jgi:hypothetical protein
MSYTFRPGAVVTLDGQAFTAAEAALVELEVQAALGELGEARLVLWPRTRLSVAAGGAKLDVALGASGSEAIVFSGTVERVTRTAVAFVIEALDAAAMLRRRFVSRAYLNQTVAAIVRDLADPVAVAEAESDLDLAQYGVENRRSVWWHLRGLAGLAGCDLATGADGRLLFRPRGRGETHRLRYGADLLHFARDEAAANTPAPAIVAHGSASRAGADRWHWLNPDPVGTAPEPAHPRGSIASDAAASAASDAAQARRSARAKTGTVALWGRPEFRPGDGVRLEALPDGDGGLAGALAGLAGGGGPEWRATRVRHSFGASAGFVTRCELEGAAAAGGSLGALS